MGENERWHSWAPLHTHARYEGIAALHALSRLLVSGARVMPILHTWDGTVPRVYTGFYLAEDRVTFYPRSSKTRILFGLTDGQHRCRERVIYPPEQAALHHAEYPDDILVPLYGVEIAVEDLAAANGSINVDVDTSYKSRRGHR